MQCTLFLYVIAGICLIFSLTMTQGAPISSSDTEAMAILSPTDISGEPVRQKRASADYYKGDYFICYPKSEVYANAYGGGPNRRSDDAVASPPRYLADDSFEARKDRADARRAAYTDSYGK